MRHKVSFVDQLLRLDELRFFMGAQVDPAKDGRQWALIANRFWAAPLGSNRAVHWLVPWLPTHFLRFQTPSFDTFLRYLPPTPSWKMRRPPPVSYIVQHTLFL